jgi:hypothetical protein
MVQSLVWYWSFTTTNTNIHPPPTYSLISVVMHLHVAFFTQLSVLKDMSGQGCRVIFKTVKFALHSLKNCRLMSRTWNRASLIPPCWEEKNWIVEMLGSFWGMFLCAHALFYASFSPWIQFNFLVLGNVLLVACGRCERMCVAKKWKAWFVLVYMEWWGMLPA